MAVTRLSWLFTLLLLIVWSDSVHAFSGIMKLASEVSRSKGSIQTRRNLLLLGGAITLAPAAAKAELSQISSLQGPIQDLISPGHWIGQVPILLFSRNSMFVFVFDTFKYPLSEFHIDVTADRYQLTQRDLDL